MEPLRHHPGPGPYTSSSSSNSIPKVSVDYGPTEAQVKHTRRRALARPTIARIIIRLLALGAGAALVTFLAQATADWYATRFDLVEQPNGFRRPTWPEEMNMLPSYVILGVAAVAVIVQAIALLTLVAGIRRVRESRLHTWTVFVTSTAVVVIWAAGAVYYKTQDSREPGHWTLWAWACSHKFVRTRKMSFEDMCLKLNVVFYAAIAVGALEIISLVLFGFKLRSIKREGVRYTKIASEGR